VTPADGVDARLGEASVVRRFADLVRPVVEATALYAGGSLAMGDFRPGFSDLDLVAVIDSGLSSHQLAELPADHVIWAHGQPFRRRFDVIARAELLRAGITVFGPPPRDLIPPVDDDLLRRAACDELAGYWTGAARQPWLWWRDAYVDVGLLTPARSPRCSGAVDRRDRGPASGRNDPPSTPAASRSSRVHPTARRTYHPPAATGRSLGLKHVPAGTCFQQGIR
jgi:hypothetical protein